MENTAELMRLLRSLHGQQKVLQEALLQLIEHTIRPSAESSLRFEHAMRQRLDAILPEHPDAQSESEMTLLLAALLASAGRPPKT